MTYIHETSNNLKTGHGLTSEVVRQLFPLKQYIFLDMMFTNLHVQVIILCPA